MSRRPVLCLTFDNLGQARDVFAGKAALPDLTSAGVATGYPNILHLLAKLSLRATFFVEGWSALHYGEVIASLLQGGHEIGLHGWIHEEFAVLSSPTARQHINDGLAVLRLRGVRPVGFRAPGGKIGPYGREILAESGLLYDSSVTSAMALDIPRATGDYAGDGLQRLPGGLIGIPWQWFMIDAIHYMLSPDGMRDPEALAAYWGRILRNVQRERGFVTLISHAHISGIVPDRLAALERVLNLALDLGFEVLPCERAIRLTEHLE